MFKKKPDNRPGIVNVKVEYRKYTSDAQFTYSHDFKNRDTYKSTLTGIVEVDVFNKKVLFTTTTYNYAIDYPNSELANANRIADIVNSFLRDDNGGCSVELILSFVEEELREAVFKFKKNNAEVEDSIKFKYNHVLSIHRDTDKDKKEIFLNTIQEKLSVMSKENKIKVDLIDDLVAYLVKIRFNILDAEKKS